MGKVRVSELQSKGFDEGIRPKLDRGREEDRWDCKHKTKNKLGPTIATTGYFIVETIQPLVNKTTLPEPTTSYYTCLRHTTALRGRGGVGPIVQV